MAKKTMPETEMTKQEIKDYILWYFDSKDEKTLKDYRLFVKLKTEAPDATEELIRENLVPGGEWPKNRQREELLNELFRQGRCGDLALENAKELVEGLLFIHKEGREDLRKRGVKRMPEWSEADEAHLRRWLLCECDDLPETIPLTAIGQVHYCGECEEAEFAAMSVVCDFPLRYAAYTFYRGVVTEFKYPLRALIVNREEGFADRALARIKEMFSTLFRLSDEEIETNIMVGFAVIFCTGDRKKQETAFYQEYIDRWMETDREHFLSVIREHTNPDFRRKVLKKLTGSAK